MDCLRTSVLRGAWSIAVVLAIHRSAAAAPLELPKQPSQRPHLKSVYAHDHDLTELKKRDTEAIVLLFLGPDCPVVQQYIPRLTSLYEAYRRRGVTMVGVYSCAGINLAQIAAHAHEQDLPFPVFLDVEHRLADLVDAQVTPEVVVLDKQFEKRYQGAIDNQFKKRGKLSEPTESYLADALEQVVSGQAVEQDYVPATGCPIERHAELLPKGEVTFYKDVLPILQANCQTCHRAGGVGPFALTTFEDAHYSAERIRETVEERRMPPWHGHLNPKYGELVNDKRLKESDIRTLVSWARQDAPEGNAQDAPAARKWPDPKAWEIGKPDYVYKIEPFKVPKSGVLEYQFFRVKLDAPEDRWVKSIEIKPGSAEVVHHVALHLVPASEGQLSGVAAMTRLYGINTESAHLINDYVPGDLYNAKTYPDHQGVLIPKHTDLVYEIHYTPNNKTTVMDQSAVAFKWARRAPPEEVLTSVFRKSAGRFRIPPHEPHHKVEDSYYFKNDVYIDAIRPHFHVRGKSFRLEIVSRDPQTGEIADRETVLDVPLYDASWQRTYELKTPLRVEAGTELLATGHFDNSEFNPNNPDPSATVQWGQQFYDEMFSTRFKYRLVKETPAVAGRAVSAD